MRHKKITLNLIAHKLLPLIRGRYVMGVFGVIMMCLFPSVAQWILGAVGVACGVSAVDAWKGAGYDPGCDSDDSDYSNNDDSTGTRSGITGE